MTTTQEPRQLFPFRKFAPGTTAPLVTDEAGNGLIRDFRAKALPADTPEEVLVEMGAPKADSSVTVSAESSETEDTESGRRPEQTTAQTLNPPSLPTSLSQEQGDPASAEKDLKNPQPRLPFRPGSSGAPVQPSSRA